jgi:hypothetical protein
VGDASDGSPEELVAFVQSRFVTVADPSKAGIMAAYMRTNQPFYGVQAAGVDTVMREALALFPCRDRSSYERHVLALWRLPHREERYLAIRYARQKKFIGPESLRLYERLIREGVYADHAKHLIRTFGHAKINLGLGIGAPRADGFHGLVTVYQTLELYDLVTVPRSGGGDEDPDHLE